MNKLYFRISLSLLFLFFLIFDSNAQTNRDNTPFYRALILKILVPGNNIKTSTKTSTFNNQIDYDEGTTYLPNKAIELFHIRNGYEKFSLHFDPENNGQILLSFTKGYKMYIYNIFHTKAKIVNGYNILKIEFSNNYIWITSNAGSQLIDLIEGDNKGEGILWNNDYNLIMSQIYLNTQSLQCTIQPLKDPNPSSSSSNALKSPYKRNLQSTDSPIYGLYEYNNIFQQALINGNSLNFNGSNNFVDVGKDKQNINSLSIGSMTLEAWVKIDPLSLNTNAIISKGSSWGLEIISNKITFYTNSSDISLTSSTILDNNWHHISAVYDDNEQAKYIYIDGNLDCKKENIYVLSDINTRNKLLIGAKENSNLIVSSYFKGNIDEVRIWNSARTNDQILTSMNDTLIGNESNLVTYYNFNNGITCGNNTFNNVLTDKSSNKYNGNLKNFILNGTSSNWIPGFVPFYKTNVCVGGNVVLSNFYKNGDWYSSNSAIATVDVNGKVTPLSKGQVQITYNYITTETNKSNTAKTFLTVNDLKTPMLFPITGDNTIDIKDKYSNLNNLKSGGIWSSSNTDIAEINPYTGWIEPKKVGETTVKYSITSSNNCRISDTSMIILVTNYNDIPMKTPITGNNYICGKMGTTQLSNSSIGGSWYSLDENIVTVNSVGLVTGLNSGTASVTYSITDILNGTIKDTFITITVYPTLNPYFKFSTHGFLNSTGFKTTARQKEFIPEINKNVIYTWYYNGQINNNSCNFRPLTSLCNESGGISKNWYEDFLLKYNPRNVGLKVSYENGLCQVGFGLSNGSGKHVLNKPIIDPPISTICCNGSSINLTTTQNGNNIYIWSKDPDAKQIINQDTTGPTNSITSKPLTNTTYYVTILDDDGCHSTSTGITINVPSIPNNTGTLLNADGTATIIKNSNIQLYNALTGGSWQSLNMKIATVQNTGLVTSISSGTVSIAYTKVVNNCRVQTITTLSVIENPTICKGENIMLNTASTGNTWTSSNNSIATVNSYGLVTGVSEGTALIRLVSFGGPNLNITVTVRGLPNVSAPLNRTVCAGTSVKLNGLGAHTYSWDNGVGNNVAFFPTFTKTYTVTGYDNFGCSNRASTTVFVNNCVANLSSITNTLYQPQLALSNNNQILSKENNINSLLKIDIIPNPAHDKVTVLLPKKMENDKVFIINFLGKIIAINNEIGTQRTFYLSNNVKGLYIAKVITKDGIIITQKFLLE